MNAFTLWKEENVKVTRGTEFLGRFNRTGFSDRQFCTRCGGHIMTHHPGFGFTDVYAAIIPSVAFTPSVHLNYAERVLPMRDGLAKLRDFPTEAGGSGEVMPEVFPPPAGRARGSHADGVPKRSAAKSRRSAQVRGHADHAR